MPKYANILKLNSHRCWK